MIYDISAIHFIRPEWFWAFLIVLVCGWRIHWITAHANAWQKVVDPHLLDQLLVGSSGNRARWKQILGLLGLSIIIVALAGPSWERLEQPVFLKQMARVIVLDLSPAMFAKDVQPSRLQRAKYKVLDLLRETHEGQTGMIVYSSEPFVVSPLTQDAATIANMVSVLSPEILPIGGNNLSLALQKAGELFKQTDAKTGSIILVTSNAGGNQAFIVAKTLAEQGYHLFVLGIGTAEGAPAALPRGGFLQTPNGDIVVNKLQKKALVQLADSGKGKYIDFTTTNQDVSQLLKLSDIHLEKNATKKTKIKTALWKDEGFWLVWLLLPLCLLSFRKGVL